MSNMRQTEATRNTIQMANRMRDKKTVDLHQDLAARDATIQQQAQEIGRLKALLKQAGMKCFIRNGTPEEVAAHMETVAASHLRHEQRQAQRIAELEAALHGTLRLIRTCQERLCSYLVPDSDGDVTRCLDDLLGMLDGPEQREVEKDARKVLAPKQEDTHA